MPVDRMPPTPEARSLIELTRDIADKVLEPRVVESERTGTFPDGVFPALGAAGLLSLPYPEEFGGGELRQDRRGFARHLLFPGAQRHRRSEFR